MRRRQRNKMSGLNCIDCPSNKDFLEVRQFLHFRDYFYPMSYRMLLILLYLLGFPWKSERLLT